MTIAEKDGAQKKGVTSVSLKRSRKVTVLGAGIAGASAAYALAQKGCEVTVIDRQGQAAAETSGNPVGIVYPKLTLGVSPLGLFHQLGFCYTRNLVTALKLPSWTPCGVTHLDTSEEDRTRHQALADSGLWPEDFLKHAGQALHQPCAGYLSPPDFCRALLSHPGITVRYSTIVTALEDLEGDVVVMTTGPDSGKFKQTEWLPLQYLRGQITYLKPTPASAKITTVICHDGFITPVIRGMQYIGATFQREEPVRPQIRPADDQENLAKLEKYMPGLGFSTAHIAGARAGYRVTTPDKLPLIGACPDYAAFIESFSGLRHGKEVAQAGKFIDRLYISTGFGAHGMTGAPLAGEIIACMIAGDPLPIPNDLQEYLAPERFILRDLKRRKI